MKEKRKMKPIKDLLDRMVEKPILEALYSEHAIATDQLRREPETLNAITNAFNRITSRNISTDTLLRYMINRRKAKDWPRLGIKAKEFESVLHLLSKSQLQALKRIYLELDITSDELLFRPELMAEIARRFKGLTNTTISGSVLVAAIVAKRKRRLWIKIREEFADIEEIRRTSGA